MLTALLTTGAAVAFAAWAVRGRSSSLLAPSLWHGPRNRPVVALTFDDGPSESTPSVLEVLARHRTVATFFQCGVQVERLPDIARAVSAAGHEIGNHGYSHRRLWLRSPGFVREEVRRAQQILTACHGRAPRFFRPPYGVRWPGLRRAQAEHSLTGVMWTALARDWRLDGDAVFRRLNARAEPGAIFCLHDGRALAPKPDIRSTVDALDRLLPVLRDRGYRFETLSGMLAHHQTAG